MKFFIGSFLSIIFISCSSELKDVTLHGETMGTTYSLKIVPSENQDIQVQNLKSEVDELLFKINMQMSTYIEESEISKFNRSKKNVDNPVSSSFLILVDTLSNSVISIGCRVVKYKSWYILLNSSISVNP